jgi:hypothetical protein
MMDTVPCCSCGKLMSRDEAVRSNGISTEHGVKHACSPECFIKFVTNPVTESTLRTLGTMETLEQIARMRERAN